MIIKKSIKDLKYLFFVPLFIYIGERSLIAFDEGFYAMQARWIIEKSNWVGPLFWDQVSSDRTIGIQFLMAIAKKLLGDALFVIYIPIFLAAILMLYCTFQLHKELLEDKNPIYSAFILSTTFLWINYSHMATQDIVFSSFVSLGIISSIKSYKTNNKFQLILSGAWIGLAVMLKTYLTAIPLIGLIPFLISSKIIYRRYFWIGFILGFIPFIFWSYQYISIYSFATYSGLFEKLIRLSKNNTFTNPFYYYFWNFSINIFPWTIPSLIGFYQASKLKNISKYFLFFYPFFIIVLLSLFSTKTPYYPLQILSLVSLNSYIGIKYLIENNNYLTSYIEKINYFCLPLLVFLSILILSFSEETSFDERARIFIFIGIGLFSFFWISYIFINSQKRKLYFSILGAYLLVLCLVQSGLITDKSKDLRIAINTLIKEEKLTNNSVEVIKSEASSNESFSKIIKIMVKTPKLGKGVNNLSELRRNNYAWTTTDINKKVEFENYIIINEDEIFYPWKLIYRR